MKTVGDHQRAGILAAIWSMVVIAALLIAPLVVAVTHGPGAQAQALNAVAVDLALGHSHVTDGDGSLQHDAADHEHQTAGLLQDPGHSGLDVATSEMHVETCLRDGCQSDGPHRPPRA
ncbi:MAG: hypothetical protein LCH69_17395 [Proteobacteria bacterium]|nr:hypothetical protein [Pseudomonadota bacterium]